VTQQAGNILKKGEQKEIKVKDLLLDPENPRFLALKQLHGMVDLTQKQLLEEIEKDDEIPTLLKSIRKSGVKDPIWVRETNDGHYLVFEGNRRTYILNKLIEEEVKPPTEVKYDTVLANVIPKNTSDTEMLLQRVRLQAGKKTWGPFSETAVTWSLRHDHNLEEEDIAAELQISLREVRERLENFRLFTEYVNTTKNADPHKFAFFAQAPKRVKDWVLESSDNRSTYFQLITPINGKQKIRSVATKGGLRDFQHILDDADALNALVKEDYTVEEALDLAKESDVRKSMPFIKRLGNMAINLQALNRAQIEQIRKDRHVKTDLKKLRKACDDIIARIEKE
jgi:hypothetical protein